MAIDKKKIIRHTGWISDAAGVAGNSRMIATVSLEDVPVHLRTALLVHGEVIEYDDLAPLQRFYQIR